MPAYQPQEKSALHGDLVIWGNDAIQELVDLWQQGFNRIYPDVHISTFMRSTGAAVGALYTGTAQVGVFGREISRDELATWKRVFPYPPVSVTVASGSYNVFAKTVAVAVLVNRDNPLPAISLEQLDALYSRDRLRGAARPIRTWGDLGLKGAWSRRPVRIYGLDEETGTAAYFRDIVMKRGHWSCALTLPPGAPRERYAGSGGDASERLVAALERDPTAIGIGGFRNTNDRVRALAISETGSTPAIEGSRASIEDRSYPLRRQIYIFVNKPPNQPWDPKVLEFLRYVLSDRGQADVRREGAFLPLPAATVVSEREKLK